MKIKLTPEALFELRCLSFFLPQYSIPDPTPPFHNRTAHLVTDDLGNAFVSKKGNLICDDRAAQVIARVVGRSSGEMGTALWTLMRGYNTAEDQIISESYAFPKLFRVPLEDEERSILIALVNYASLGEWGEATADLVYYPKMVHSCYKLRNAAIVAGELIADRHSLGLLMALVGKTRSNIACSRLFSKFCERIPREAYDNEFMWLAQ